MQVCNSFRITFFQSLLIVRIKAAMGGISVLVVRDTANRSGVFIINGGQPQLVPNIAHLKSHLLPLTYFGRSGTAQKVTFPNDAKSRQRTNVGKRWFLTPRRRAFRYNISSNPTLHTTIVKQKEKHHDHANDKSFCKHSLFRFSRHHT